MKINEKLKLKSQQIKMENEKTHLCSTDNYYSQSRSETYRYLVYAPEYVPADWQTDCWRM